MNRTVLKPPIITEDGFIAPFDYNHSLCKLSVHYVDDVWADTKLKEFVAKSAQLITASFIPNSNFVVEYPISPEGIKLLYLINKHTNVYNASLGGTEIYKPSFRYTLAETEKYDLKTKKNNVSLFLSGGKDSLTTLGMLRETNFDVTNIFVQPSAAWWFGACQTFRDFGGYRIRENVSMLYPRLRKLGNQILRSINQILMWAPLALPIMERERTNLLLYGNELLISEQGPQLYKNEPHYGTDFDQNQEGMNILDDYLSSSLDVRVGSIVSPMYTIKIQKTLCERYPDLYKHQLSCITAQPKDGRFGNCGSCSKCHRVYLTIKSLGYDPSIIGLDKEKIKKRYPVSQLFPTMSLEAFSVLSKSDYYPRLKAKAEVDLDSLVFDQEFSNVSFLGRERFKRIYSLFDSPYILSNRDGFTITKDLDECFDFLKQRTLTYDFSKTNLPKVKSIGGTNFLPGVKCL